MTIFAIQSHLVVANDLLERLHSDAALVGDFLALIFIFIRGISFVKVSFDILIYDSTLLAGPC